MVKSEKTEIWMPAWAAKKACELALKELETDRRRWQRNVVVDGVRSEFLCWITGAPALPPISVDPNWWIETEKATRESLEVADFFAGENPEVKVAIPSYAFEVVKERTGHGAK